MPYIAIRDPLAEAKDTLSSWDKCMAKSYCKWPVIVVIIVGVLVILSTAFCVYQCGKCATCCCCCNCCSCCRSSGGGGDGGGHKRMKSGEPYPMPAQGYNHTPIAPPIIDNRPIHQQYRSHPVPTFAPAEPERPQYAKFESQSKPVNEDALPAMPSWSEAKSTRVEEVVMPEKRGDMEMDRLDHNGTATSAAAIGHARRSPGPSPVQRSPTHDNYGFPPDYQNDSFVSAAPQRNQHSGPGSYGSQYHQHEDDYRGMSPVSSLSTGYAAGAGYGRRPANEGYVQPYQNEPRRSPGPSHGYDAPEYHNNYSTPPPNAQNYNTAAYHNEPIEMPSPIGNRAHSPQYAPSGSTRYEPVELPSPVAAHHPQSGPYEAPGSMPYEAPGSRSYEAPGSTRYDHPAALYPGQQTYAPEPSYPSQPSYQAYQPQETGVTRKAVQGL